MQEIRARATLNVGAAVLVTVAIGYVVLWVVARPPHEPTARYIGEICGAEALLLFSCSLVLATFLRPIERSERNSGSSPATGPARPAYRDFAGTSGGMTMGGRSS